MYRSWKGYLETIYELTRLRRDERLDTFLGDIDADFACRKIIKEDWTATLVFQLQDTVCLFGTLLVFDPIHLPKGET